jgi:hypothetical protein
LLVLPLLLREGAGGDEAGHPHRHYLSLKVCHD